ncbi:MAG: tRNA (N(6)-L-threonylcarbamoyladenosine(37)-C(2))-methylthiotransferase MtaB [Ruminococcaceae bacterium]|nr:tRNA (N(6)-L-threonylcarbamoyladenosine(37)-C(2))-methylthiotransferase MtaB [Oscillospiraceae bacterium]
MRIAICTLGCKVNQYETQAIEQELLRRGHTLVDFEDEADAYVVNTCSVTAVSDKKSRQMIRRAQSRNPNAVIAACGCYAQTHAEDVSALGVDVLAGTNDRLGFLDLLERAAEEKTRIVHLDDALHRREFEVLPAGGMAARTRAMLKIEDGCVNFCTYCLIPFARGPVRSLPMDEASLQVKKLVDDGYKEIVLTGIEISSYGQDIKEQVGLIDLLERLCREAPTLRVRLGSLEPRTITRDFCERAAGLENLCPHFHLSLQSGCDATLKRMNRRYDTARYAESCALLREFFDDPAITTDLITGFPEETEEEFAQTLAFIRGCAFADMHIFPYSIRPGTKAAAMAQVEKHVKEERAARAAEAAAAMKAEYLARCVGRTFPVLFEGTETEGSAGHAPNYTEVYIEEKGLQNEARPVRVIRSDGERLYGELE